MRPLLHVLDARFQAKAAKPGEDWRPDGRTEAGRAACRAVADAALAAGLLKAADPDGPPAPQRLDGKRALLGY